MSKENDIPERFKEQRRKRSLSHASVAEICGVSKTTVISWEKGSKIPADALAVLMAHGFDPIYILTGHDQNLPQMVMLDPEEVVLVDLFRALSADSKTKLQGYLDGLIDRDVEKGTSPTIRKRKKP